MTRRDSLRARSAGELPDRRTCSIIKPRHAPGYSGVPRRATSTALCVDRRVRHLPDAAHHGRYSRHAGPAHGAARSRVRVEPRRDFGRRRDQHRALRPDRTLRRVGNGPMGPPAARGLRAGAPRHLRRAHHADAQPVARDAVVGRVCRDRHRGHVDGAGRCRRHPVVRCAARHGAGCALGGQRHGAARVPAVARRRGRTAGMAGGRTPRRGRRRGCLCRRADLHARSAGRHRAAAVRSAARREPGSRPDRARPLCGAAHGGPLAGVLGAGGHFLRVRRQHERADRHAPDRRLPRLRHPADAIGAAARA